MFCTASDGEFPRADRVCPSNSGPCSHLLRRSWTLSRTIGGFLFFFEVASTVFEKAARPPSSWFQHRASGSSALDPPEVLCKPLRFPPAPTTSLVRPPPARPTRTPRTWIPELFTHPRLWDKRVSKRSTCFNKNHGSRRDTVDATTAMTAQAPSCRPS